MLESMGRAFGLGSDVEQSPSESRRTRRIAILGFAETVADAPVSDPSWEFWGMNGFHRQRKDIPEDRYSLWFDLHSIDYIKRYGVVANIPGEQEEWLTKPHPFPVMMLEQFPEFPASVRFPVEDVISQLGREYFTSTVAYELAWALCQPDVAEIGLWGIDLVHGTEWGDQRPCAEYWIGRAEAQGIKVTIHEKSAVLKQRYRYGYEVMNPVIQELRPELERQIEGLTKAIDQHQQKIGHMTNQMHTDDGARQATIAILERLEMWSRGGRI